MFSIRLLTVAALFTVASLSTLVQPVAAQQPLAQPPAADLARRAETQKNSQSQVDQVVRRMETVMRALRYQGLQGIEEHALLEEASKSLTSLSQKEMIEVINRLKQASTNNTGPDLAKAYQEHQAILSRLLEVSLRRQALRTLAEAAARARKASLAEERIQEQLAGEIAGATAPQVDPAKLLQARQARLIDTQRDLSTEVGMLLRQATSLEGKLDPKHTQMLKKGLDEAAKDGLIARLGRIQQMISPNTLYNDRKNGLRPSLEEARLASQTLAKMARAWHEEEPEELALRHLLDGIVRAEENLAESRKKPATETTPAPDQKTDEERRQNAEKKAELTQQALDLANQAKQTQKTALPAEPPLREAAQQLRAALEEKLAGKPDTAAAPLEARAQQELSKARAKVEEALQKKREERAAKRQEDHRQKLDILTAKQEKLNKETEAAANNPATAPDKPEEANKLAAKQAELAREAAKLAAAAPDKAEAAALAEAATQQAEATRDLADKETPKNNAKEAAAPQKEALAQLKKAQKNLAELAAKNNQARDARQQHEKIADKLEDAARRQDEIAKKAKDLASKDKLKDAAATELAQAQDQVKNAVEEAMRESANDKALDAARTDAKEAVAEQKASNEELRANQPAEAARDAREAADALNEAARQARDLARKDAADQALAEAMNSADLEGVPQAAKRLGQALEDAKAARDEARKATEAMENKPTANLAREQAKLAKDLDAKAETKPAADAAKNAAEELKGGDLEGAMEAQQAVLDQLKPAQGEGTPNQKAAAASQKKLLEATRALAKSADRAEMAETGSKQAEGLLPEALLPALAKAEKALQAGRQAAKQGNAPEATVQQEAAVKGLEQSLAQLELLAQAMESARPDLDLPEGLAQATPMPGEPTPSTDPMANAKPAPMPETKDKPGTPGLVAQQTGKLSTPEQLKDPEGAGRFLRLPAREREALVQAWTEGLPPAHAALVQRYFRDLARNAKPSQPTPQGKQP